VRAPNGIRTRAAALKGRSPRPLDDGGNTWTAFARGSSPSGTGQAYGVLHARSKPEPEPMLAFCCC
jgi:hypothetical protein